MNINLDIPVNATFLPVQLKELEKELVLHAIVWIDKFVAKNNVRSNELFKMPEEFETLCGSVNKEDVEKARLEDPMLDALMEKYK